jgi:LEA14-like dessication related protein
MNYGRRLALAGAVLMLGGLGACASLPENVISKPEVELRDVRVMGLGFKSQTFLLSFDIRNPNPFPLPVNHVSYGVRLDGLRFASGQTTSDISVPAGGESQFAISVDLDLLSTAPRLLSIVRDGTRREIPYQLEGQLGVDIPMTPPLNYRTEGSIRLDTGGF